MGGLVFFSFYYSVHRYIHRQAGVRRELDRGVCQ